MELNKNSSPATTTYHGKGDFSLGRGKSLKIETTPEGEELLNERVPSGKEWRVIISIDVTETDA